MTVGQKRARADLIETIESHGLEEFSCPICSPTPTKSLVIGSVDRHNLSLRTVICLRCGSPRSQEVLASHSLETFYENIYRRLYHTSAGPNSDFFHDQFTRGERLVRKLQPFIRSEARVLEIGCGAGGIVSAFSNSGYPSTGIDFENEYLDFGRGKGLDLRGTSISEWDEKVDVVVLSHVLEHLTDPSGFLRAISRLLEDDGILVVEIPNIFSLVRTYGGSLRTYLQYAHVFHFDRWSLRRITHGAGFNRLYDDTLTIGIYQKQKRLSTESSNPRSTKRSLRVVNLTAFLVISRILSCILLPALKLTQALIRNRRHGVI